MTNPTRRKSHWPADLGAGITGAIAGAPQAMAFAIIAGVSPIYGLYTAIVSTIVGAMFNSSVYMTVGPTNALALVVGSALLPYDGAAAIDRLFMLTFLVGVFQFLFGALRLGDVTRFVSDSVMTGFITGAGCLIILGQFTELTGYEDARGDLLLLRTLDVLLNLSAIHLPTLAIGALSLGMIWGLHHTRLRTVATLITLAVTGVLVSELELSGVALVRDMAHIPSGLPAPVLLDFRLAPELWSVAAAMAVLSLVQSAGLVQNIPQPADQPQSTSRDFIGQGMANLVGGVFQGMPAGGSLSRTAVNLSAGAQTRWANVVAGGCVALILLMLGRYIEQIPLAALAGHLIIAASSLIKPDRIRLSWDVNASGRYALLSTLLATFILPLEYSIYIGVGLSLALYLYRSASHLRVQQLIPLPDGRFREDAPPKQLTSGTPIIISIYGNLYFAAVDTLRQRLPAIGGAERPVVVLRLKGNQYMGSTGLRLLEDYAAQLEAVGGLLVLTGVGPEVAGQMARSGMLERFGTENVFYENNIVLASTQAGLRRAHAWLSALPAAPQDR